MVAENLKHAIEQLRTRVPHLRDGSIVAKVGLALRATALLYVAIALPAAAQSTPCGITSISESTKLQYPPIARAAHVQGTIVLMVQFSLDGKPTHIVPISGPLMLHYPAIEFVKGWQANPYTGPRECPIAIQFVLGHESDTELTIVERSDLQHIRILAHPATPVTMDSVAAK